MSRRRALFVPAAFMTLTAFLGSAEPVAGSASTEASPVTTVPTRSDGPAKRSGVVARQGPDDYKSYRQQLGTLDGPEGNSALASLSISGPYSNWSWPNGGFYYNADERIQVHNYSPGASLFWSHQFSIENGDGGYIGLQTGSFPNDTKIALYSVWGANGASGGNCGVFSGEGSGYTCRLDPYNWVEGRNYRLRVWAVGVDSQGEWYGAWVQDESTGVDTHIGSIRVPLGSGGIQGWVSWTEYFGPPVTTCEDLPQAAVSWHYPSANGGAVNISGHSHFISQSDCRPYTHIDDLNASDLQLFGYLR